jgi:hypothetical protein
MRRYFAALQFVRFWHGANITMSALRGKADIRAYPQDVRS